MPTHLPDLGISLRLLCDCQGPIFPPRCCQTPPYHAVLFLCCMTAAVGLLLSFRTHEGCARRPRTRPCRKIPTHLESIDLLQKLSPEMPEGACLLFFSILWHFDILGASVTGEKLPFLELATSWRQQRGHQRAWLSYKNQPTRSPHPELPSSVWLSPSRRQYSSAWITQGWDQTTRDHP